MKRVIVPLFLLLSLAACDKRPPGAPGDVAAERQLSTLNASFSLAPGDTLKYVISWTAGARAVGYVVTTTASTSGWTGLLAASPTTALSKAFTPIHLAAWDSTNFTACVASTAPGKPNSADRCTTWKIVRGPGPPGPPIVDSSQTIAAIILKPDAVTLVASTGVQQFCPYAKSLDGKVRFISGYENLPVCQTYYDAMPVGDRLPGYPVAVTHTEQWWNITVGDNVLRVATRPAQQELAKVIFAGAFG